MRRFSSPWKIAAVALVCCAPGFAFQAGGAGVNQWYCRYFQPWSPPRAAHRSIVQSCAAPTPVDRVALDDFRCAQGGEIVRLRWWGEILDPEQLGPRRYYVAIYSDQDCAPDELLYETCVVPQVRPVQLDCRETPVFHFRAPIPFFEIEANTRYWLQISEDDSDSANPGQDDFLWSGRRPLRACPAVQMDAAGSVYSPLIDPCFQTPNDLSFALRLTP